MDDFQDEIIVMVIWGVMIGMALCYIGFFVCVAQYVLDVIKTNKIKGIAMSFCATVWHMVMIAYLFKIRQAIRERRNTNCLK